MRKPDDFADRYISQAERHLAESLLKICESMPVGGMIPDSDAFRKTLWALEIVITEALSECYSEWQGESLDGISSLKSQKTGERTVSLFGQCIMITDQSIAPIFVSLQVSSVGNQVNWLECRLGIKGENGMVKTPHESMNKEMKELIRLDYNPEVIDWAYWVKFGDEAA